MTSRGVGSTGGAEKHKLTVNQMPTHSHSLEYPMNRWGGGGSRADTHFGTIQGGRPTNWKRDTKLQGKSDPHPIMPPYYVLAYIMKMEDEIQDSEIKTKEQYQTEIQDLQAKIQNSESKMTQLESKVNANTNKFKDNTIRNPKNACYLSSTGKCAPGYTNMGRSGILNERPHKFFHLPGVPNGGHYGGGWHWTHAYICCDLSK